VLENRKIGAFEALFRTIREPHAIAVVSIDRSMCDDPDTSPESSQDLAAFRNDNMNLFFALHLQ
jgi:hypothetical protein